MGEPPWSLRWQTLPGQRTDLPCPRPRRAPWSLPLRCSNRSKGLAREGASIEGNAMTRRLKSEERTRHFHTMTCRHCGRRRRVKRENAKYCSGKCKQAAFRDRRRRTGSRNDEWAGERLQKANREVGKVVVPTAVTRSPESEAEHGFQKASFRDPRQEMPPRRKSPQKVPPGWLGAQPGDYLGETSMYAWPA